MLARLQRLIPSELRDLLSQRSDFAEKQQNSNGWNIQNFEILIADSESSDQGYQ